MIYFVALLIMFAAYVLGKIIFNRFDPIKEHASDLAFLLGIFAALLYLGVIK